MPRISSGAGQDQDPGGRQVKVAKAALAVAGGSAVGLGGILKAGHVIDPITARLAIAAFTCIVIAALAVAAYALRR